MADDDPYNFEIAIPSAASGARTVASYGRARYDESDEEESSGESSDDAMSELDGDEDEEESLDRSRKDKPTVNKSVSKAAPAVASSGGGNALDKAKSFLSKYTAKPVETKVTSATSRRRVELSLDDEDFSVDSSHDASRRKESDDESEYQDSETSPVKKPDRKKATSVAATPAVVKSTAMTRLANLAANESPEQSYREESRDEESCGVHSDKFGDESGEDPPPYTAPSVPAVIAATAPASILMPAVQWKPSVALRQPDPDEESIHDDSGASQSEIDETQDQSTRGGPSLPSRFDSSNVTRGAVANQSAPSESGAYEEEAFEDDSLAPSPDTRSMPPAVGKTANDSESLTYPTKSEPTFDYSMDFSDDGDGGNGATVEVIPQPLSTVKTTPIVDDESDRERDEEHSALLESDDKSHDLNELRDQSPSTELAQVNDAEKEEIEKYSREEQSGEEVYSTQFDSKVEDYKDGSLHKEDQVIISPSLSLVICDPTPPINPVQSQNPVNENIKLEGADVVSSTKPRPSTRSLETLISKPARVTIVREYAVNGGEKPEMRDASTQFTGNHAGIQTDLVPDGMHNLREAASASINTAGGRENSMPSGFSEPPRTNPSPNLPSPPPPPSLPFHATSSQLPQFYNMDLLQQPIATSTSLYKQQLLALQEQILQKKRETERLVSERMNFQYGSSRGTERFIAGRRPPRLQLWEALMRVDPTLDEMKAKEAARLAQDGYVA